MRVAVALLLLGTFLSGCQVPGGDGEDFQRSCPTWFAAPDRPQSTIQFYHNGNSENPEAREEEDRSRWVVHPGVGGGHFWRNGTTDYYLVDMEVFVDDENGTRHSAVVDSVIRAQAFRSPWQEGERENPATPEGEEIPEPEHGRLLFIDMSDPRNPRTVSEIVVREGETLDKQYKIALTDGHGAADPWSLRIDWFFEGNQDDDDDTVSIAVIKMKAERWYRHNDCIS